MIVFLYLACGMGLTQLTSDSGSSFENALLSSDSNEIQDTAVDNNISDTGIAYPSEPATEPATEPQEDDADGDGFTESEGDCDDSLDIIHPNAIDVCDGYDNNCDGQIDEQADLDSYEPNDTYAYNIGMFNHTDSSYVYANIHHEIDSDRYQFYISDEIWEPFKIDLSLFALSSDVDYVLELWQLSDSNGNYVGQLEVSDVSEFGGNERIVRDGIPFIDDAGWYEIVVYSSSGGGCDASYEIELEFGL